MWSKMIHNNQYDIYLEGYNSYFLHRLCPYKGGSQESISWHEGFADALNDDLEFFDEMSGWYTDYDN